MADLRKQQVEAQGGDEEDAKGTRAATIPAAPPSPALPPYAPSMWSAHRKTLLLQSKQQAARTGSGSGRACGGGRGSGGGDGTGGCGGGGDALHAAAIRVMTYRALRDAPVCSFELGLILCQP